MGFLTTPLLRVGWDDQWSLERPLEYVTLAGEKIVVPPGFITDLASIPHALQGVVPVNGKHRPAAILHDYLYVIQDRSRSEVDSLFLEAMESCEVRFTQRWAMYLAVRAAGWMFWNQNVVERKHDLPQFMRRNGL